MAFFSHALLPARSCVGADYEFAVLAKNSLFAAEQGIASRALELLRELTLGQTKRVKRAAILQIPCYFPCLSGNPGLTPLAQQAEGETIQGPPATDRFRGIAAVVG